MVMASEYTTRLPAHGAGTNRKTLGRVADSKSDTTRIAAGLALAYPQPLPRHGAVDITARHP